MLTKYQLKIRKDGWLFEFVTVVLLIIIGLITLYPFWNVFVLALNEPLDTLRGGVYFWPRKFTLENMRQILSMRTLAVAFKNSILRTVIGTAFSVVSISMFSYCLSRRDYILRKPLQRMLVTSMYINGGLIPYFFVIKNLGLYDNFMVYIIPFMLNAFYVMFTRAFMDSLPDSLHESAEIDGANDFQIYLKIIIPLSLPILATLILFCAVDQWNSWYDTHMYTKSEALTTLQHELVKVLSKSTAKISNYRDLQSKLASGQSVVSTPQSIRMAITVVATVPILLVYPFVQRYFITGLTLGALKG